MGFNRRKSYRADEETGSDDKGIGNLNAIFGQSKKYRSGGGMSIRPVSGGYLGDSPVFLERDVL